MKPFYIFFIIIFLTCQLKAQSDFVQEFEKNKQRAIQNLVFKTKRDTSRINALINVFSLALINKQRQQVLPYWNEALSLSRDLNYKEGLCACYLFKGRILWGEGRPTDAHTYFDSVIQLGNHSGDGILKKYEAYAHEVKALIYQQQEIIYKSLHHHFRSLQYYEQNDSVRTMNTYSNITDLYLRSNNPALAIQFAQKNIEYTKGAAYPGQKIQAYLNLSIIYLKQKNISKTFYYLNQVHQYIPFQQEHSLNTNYYIQRGEAHFLSQQYDSALFNYEKAYAIASQSTHGFNRSSVLSHLSQAALKAGKLKLAKTYADENMMVSDMMGKKAGRINSYQNLAEYYKAIGDDAKAYQFLEKASFLKDSLAEETNYQQVNTLAAAFESEKKETEIMRLENEQQQQLSITRRRTLTIYLLVVITVALVWVCFLIYRNYKKDRQLHKQEQALQDQKIIDLEKDRQLSSITAMLKGQEEERSRIAKDLHDGLGGLLSGTKLAFSNIRETMILEKEDAIRFDKSLHMLDNTISDMRKIAHNLMPEALVRFGLEEALTDFCDYINSTTSANLTYQAFGEKRALSNTAETFIYRIFQELINNSIKHAKPSEIIVQLTKTSSKTIIAVEDDGLGFDTAILNSNKGSGFANIRYRVQYFNGVCDIVSTPQKGTLVTIELPI